ncbi:hypothetical protein ABZ656_33890 [Streptomyces sp. NPDC007095]|uniref:hypothetical protein n=1 Tax=Streptomyces sp. NPDC007095 TaxID=3154482 RepID=UPI0033BFEE93
MNANRDPKKPPMAYPEPAWRPGDPVPDEAKAEQDKARAKAAYAHILTQTKGE